MQEGALLGQVRAISKKKPRLQLTTCKACGGDLQDADRTYCDNCLAEQRREQQGEWARAAHESLAQLRAEGRDPAHSEEANANPKLAQRKHAEERSRWVAQEHNSDPAAFDREIRPHLRNVPLSRIKEATGLSKPFCSRIRRGESRPHPRHCGRLAKSCRGG